MHSQGLPIGTSRGVKYEKFLESIPESESADSNPIPKLFFSLKESMLESKSE